MRLGGTDADLVTYLSPLHDGCGWAVRTRTMAIPAAYYLLPSTCHQVRLGGTDADLRKLTTDDCVRWLTPHGYTNEQLSRKEWKPSPNPNY